MIGLQSINRINFHIQTSLIAQEQIKIKLKMKQDQRFQHKKQQQSILLSDLNQNKIKQILNQQDKIRWAKMKNNEFNGSVPSQTATHLQLPVFCEQSSRKKAYQFYSQFFEIMNSSVINNKLEGELLQNKNPVSYYNVSFEETKQQKCQIKNQSMLEQQRGKEPNKKTSQMEIMELAEQFVKQEYNLIGKKWEQHKIIHKFHQYRKQSQLKPHDFKKRLKDTTLNLIFQKYQFEDSLIQLAKLQMNERHSSIIQYLEETFKLQDQNLQYNFPQEKEEVIQKILPNYYIKRERKKEKYNEERIRETINTLIKQK